MTYNHTIQVAESMENALRRAARKLNIPKKEAIPLLLKIGLEHLEAAEYDVTKCILDTNGEKITLPSTLYQYLGEMSPTLYQYLKE